MSDYPMRRFRQQLDDAACLEMLEKETHGVLALCGADGQPYALPTGYAFAGDCLYFHSAPAGKKLSIIAENTLASFCIVGMDEIVPEKLTTYYKSLIIEGTMEIVQDEKEKRRGLQLIGEKYAPDDPQRLEREIEKSFPRVQLLKLTIRHMTGKQSIELVKKQSKA